MKKKKKESENIDINRDREIEMVLEESSKSDRIERSLRVLWNLFKEFSNNKEIRDLYLVVKFDGVHFSFDIRNVIYGEVDEYLDSNNVKIKGCKKINIQEYWDELEAREIIMKNVLRDKIQGGLQEEGFDPTYDE